MCIWSESVFDLAINCHDCTTNRQDDDGDGEEDDDDEEQEEEKEEDEHEKYSNSRVLGGGSDLTRIIQS